MRAGVPRPDYPSATAGPSLAAGYQPVGDQPEDDFVGPPPPEDLEESGRRLWEFIAGGGFDLEVHELLVLHNSCRIADNLDRIAAEVAVSEVSVVNSRGDIVAHAAYVEHRQQTGALTKALATLRIPDQDGNRPQRRGGARGTYGATKR